MASGEDNSLTTKLKADEAGTTLEIERRDYEPFLEAARQRHRPAGNEEERLVSKIAGLQAESVYLCKLRGDLLLDRMTELEACIREHRVPSISNDSAILEHLSEAVLEELDQKRVRLAELQARRRRSR